MADTTHARTMGTEHYLCRLCNQRHQAVTATHLVEWEDGGSWFLCPEHLDRVMDVMDAAQLYQGAAYHITVLMNRVM